MANASFLEDKLLTRLGAKISAQYKVLHDGLGVPLFMGCRTCIALSTVRKPTRSDGQCLVHLSNPVNRYVSMDASAASVDFNWALSFKYIFERVIWEIEIGFLLLGFCPPWQRHRLLQLIRVRHFKTARIK